jgi:hypothetical protein
MAIPWVLYPELTAMPPEEEAGFGLYLWCYVRTKSPEMQEVSTPAAQVPLKPTKGLTPPARFINI